MSLTPSVRTWGLFCLDQTPTLSAPWSLLPSRQTLAAPTAGVDLTQSGRILLALV